jgi:amino acid adenylation domain-containing protein
MIGAAEAAGVHKLFEAHARTAPEAPAVLLDDREVSYGELNSMANRLAHRLRAMGVGEEVFVGICARRTVETLAAILSVLKAGGAFVPLDPNDPPRRLRTVLDDVGPRVVLAAPGDQVRFPGQPTLWVGSVARSAEDGDLPGGTDPGHAACAYHTSGSGGTPKAVVMEHCALLHKFHWYVHDLLGKRRAKVPAVSALTFGQSQYQFFAPWLRGDPVWLLDDGAAGDPVAVLRALSGQPHAGMLCVPQLWEAMLNASDQGLAPMPDTLAFIGLAGDGPSRSLLDRTFATLPHVEVWNIYAATETGISMAARLRPGEPLRLGRPVSGMETHVLDRDLRPVGGEEVGELHVGGAGLARGYLGRPELTGERFIPHPFDREPGARLFKTGDLVRRRADGSLEFVARRDRLLKIRGFRIDPREVEEAICMHPAVARCAVTAACDERGRERLVAHLIPAAGTAPTVAELRGFLSSSLPRHMVPSRLAVLDALPTTPSGKVDRHVLRMPDVKPGSGTAPHTELERWMVAMWQKVLGIDRIGVSDDFFELGGDSLSALLVVDEVRHKTGVALAATVLLEAPTPALLAELIARSGPGAESSPLVTIRPDGSRRAFFCAAPLPVTLLPLRRLASHIDADRPVHVLQSAGPDHHDATAERLAARYVAAIREVQPTGPYLLGGQCFGGVIALQAAHQLQAGGHAVSLLALFDVPAPPVRTAVAEPGRRRVAIADRLRRSLRVPRRSLTALWKAVGEARRLGSTRPRTVITLYRRRRRWALFEWPSAEPYPGPVCLFLSTRLAATMPDAEARWRAVAGTDLDTVIVPSSHQELLLEPAVREVAAELNRRLEAAEAGV